LPPRNADPERRLRVGYVSGDFGRHPVGFFLRPVLANHDRAGFEITCYSTRLRSDALAETLKQSAANWREVGGMPDDALAAQIAADGIDILVDLSGHTAHNRLSLFARRAAPIQASWLGFWGTTGLAAMDYLLTDASTLPPGCESGFSETLLRLPGIRFCYGPPDDAPEPTWRNKPVTFGSFNNLAKVGPDAVRLWRQVLDAVPGSKLVLKWRTLADRGLCRRLRADFGDRVDLRGASGHAAMLAEYADIDVALDPLPFSGGATSCEALWMGVPVVTLPGSGAASRQTLGFLRALGRTEWAAKSPEDYVRIAAGLAADRAALGQLRTSLRAEMAASPLCDGAAFTRELEQAYRAIWRKWCATSSSGN